MEICYTVGEKNFVHPIIELSRVEVWEFIKDRKLPYCCLYDSGSKRIGCIFCPFAPKSEKRKHYECYPKMTNAFRKAVCRLYKLRKEQGRTSVDRWKDGAAMFEWWLWEPPKEDTEPGLFT